jgi:dihydrofolate reductase
MKISLIVALTREGVIGTKDGLPWHIPSDLKYFQRRTKGKTVLMGRTTFDTIGRPLPRRNNLVLDHKERSIKGAWVFGSIDKALEKAKELGEELFVIGGASVYHQMMSKANYLYMSHVKRSYQGDVYFPRYDKRLWKEVKKEEYDEFVAVVYRRVRVEELIKQS